VSEYAFILPIAAVSLLGAMSPGPSFVIVAKTALAKSMGFLNDLVWYGMVVLLFSRPKAQRGYLCFKVWIDRLAGGVLGILGLKLIATP